MLALEIMLDAKSGSGSRTTHMPLQAPLPTYSMPLLFVSVCHNTTVTDMVIVALSVFAQTHA